MKYITVFLMAVALFLSACTPKTYYTKPEIVGKIYNSKTKTPLANKEGYISFSLGLTEDNKIKTLDNGQFKIPAKAEYYYYFKPNMKNISMSAPQIYINFNGYYSKIYDYSDAKLLTDVPNPGARKMTKIDVGIIYLDPK